MVRIADVASDILSRISRAALEKNVTLQVAIAPHAAEVEMDRTALEQILGNLTENALRHTSAGIISVTSATSGDKIEISVRDSGAGIPPEHLPRIFERFYRASAGRDRESGGVGLGLAIVKHLVEAHGGSVGAESSPGSGTTIRILIPKHAA